MPDKSASLRACETRNDPLFYELCDELGLYVVDEANIESHGVSFSWDKTLGNKDRCTETAWDFSNSLKGPCRFMIMSHGER